MTTYQQFNQESQQKPSDVEKLYIQLQGTFGVIHLGIILIYMLKASLFRV